jgi:hypothetical protein
MFVACHFCLSEINPLLSLCNGFSFSAAPGSTTGPIILEQHVEWLAICLVFQGHTGNSTLVAAIVFPKSEEITRG